MAKWKRIHLVTLTTHSALKLQGSLHGDVTLKGRDPRAPTCRETTWVNGPPTTRVILSKILSFSPVKQPKDDQGDAALALSLDIRADLSTGRRPRYFHF